MAAELSGSFVVTNPHGLHARPAARLVQEVRRRDAHARIRNRRTASEWVDAGSLSKIATLGVRSGDEVEVRVSGSQAAESLDHILALAARSFDESPGESVHAVLHTIDVILRHPFPGRWQPYLAGGYGMVMVFPGPSLNADPVTKNMLTVGGGLEFYVRNDLAIRADLRQSSVFGKQKDRDGVVVYDYSQGTIGLAFYRSIQP